VNAQVSLSLSLLFTPSARVLSGGRETCCWRETRRARVGETAVVSGRGPETEAALNEKILVLEEDRDNGSEEGKRSRCSLVNTRDGASLRVHVDAGRKSGRDGRSRAKLLSHLKKGRQR